MGKADAHLRDDQILLLAEDTSGDRSSGPHQHLLECPRCQIRQRDLMAAAAEIEAHCRDGSSSADARHERTRLALQSRLAQEAAATGRPWPSRVRDALAPGAGWMALAAAVVGVAVWLADRPTPGPRLSAMDALPVAAITPGAVKVVRLEALCAGSLDAPPIPHDMRTRVLRDYRMLDVPADQYELDYLITPELGGATDPRNLWPQRYGDRTWNARVKDELEQLLPQLVCSRQLDLALAQRDMADDWVAAYKKYFQTSAPRRTYAALTRAGHGAQRPVRPGQRWLRLASVPPVFPDFERVTFSKPFAQ